MPGAHGVTAGGVTAGLMLDAIASIAPTAEVAVFVEAAAGGYLLGLDTFGGTERAIEWRDASLALGVVLWPE